MNSDWDDEPGVSGGYSGTFRWKTTKKLPCLPPRTVPKSVCSDVSDGWVNFFVSRFVTKEQITGMMNMAHADMSLIDCLSSPLTVAQKCFELSIVSEDVSLDKLIILCTGASAKAEERILRETNCWHELRHCFAHKSVHQVELWLIGPEMTATQSPYTASMHAFPDGLSVHVFKGTSSEFFRCYPSRMNNSDAAVNGAIVDTLVVGLNCGFGNWENHRGTERQFGLLYDWIGDLFLLSSLRFPLVFTCANDYADMAGETLVMSQVLGE